MHFLCGFVLHNESRMVIWSTKLTMLSYNGWLFGIFFENVSVVILGQTSITVLLTESCLNKEPFGLINFILYEAELSFTCSFWRKFSAFSVLFVGSFTFFSIASSFCFSSLTLLCWLDWLTTLVLAVVWDCRFVCYCWPEIRSTSLTKSLSIWSHPQSPSCSFASFLISVLTAISLVCKVSVFISSSLVSNSVYVPVETDFLKFDIFSAGNKSEYWEIIVRNFNTPFATVLSIDKVTYTQLVKWQPRTFVMTPSFAFTALYDIKTLSAYFMTAATTTWRIIWLYNCFKFRICISFLLTKSFICLGNCLYSVIFLRLRLIICQNGCTISIAAVTLKGNSFNTLKIMNRNIYRLLVRTVQFMVISGPQHDKESYQPVHPRSLIREFAWAQ